MRIRNLPPGTQEGLLQQTLEQYAAIKRLEVYEEINQATVELENAAACHPRTYAYPLLTPHFRRLESCCCELSLSFLMGSR